MSNSDGHSGFARQSIPQITTFQFSNDAVGKIKDSVNLFTGTSNIPVNIASLPGRKDLDVNIGILYDSNVQHDVKNWNLTNPTGILGLGWDMARDRIVVNNNGSTAVGADEYYLLSNGSANQLIQDGFTPASPEAIRLFQTRNFEFWDISYDPGAEKWTVRKEDGTVLVYGDKNSGRGTVEYAVGWGAWLGDAATASGQEQHAISWSLSEMQNVWGEKVTYAYENVQVKLGSANGLEYTEASYLKQITDSFNRTITFSYGEKYGARNPGTRNIVEYQAAHTQTSPYNAYQQQYETRYLDQIEVKNAQGKLQFTIVFEYDFINTGSASQTTVYPLTWKRVLTSFWQVQPDGRSLPGMEFSYYDKASDINAGALKTITYPQGARATYAYKQQPLNTSRNIKADSLVSGGTPRVWFGPDYTVITWYNAGTRTLRARVYSWCGNWVTFDLNSDQPTSRYFDNVDFDLDTLGVITRQDFIALYFTERSQKQLQVFLYRRDPESFGVFNLSGGPRYLPVKSATARTGVTAGRDFVIAFSKDFTTTPVTAFQWNWKQKRWDTSPSNNPGAGYIPVLLPSPSDISKATNLVVTARDNYYIAALYNPSGGLLQFQLFYHDGLMAWGKSTLYGTSNVKIYQDPDNPSEFPFNLSLSAAFATATYITVVSQTEIAYSLRILQWDRHFNLLNPSTPLVNDYKCPVTDSRPQFSVFNTILTDALVSNNPFQNRYTGGVDQSNNPLNWKQASFQSKPTDKVTFTPGTDMAILSVDQGGTAVNQYLQFDPDTGTWDSPQNLGSSGTHPTVSGNFITAGSDIFCQDTRGRWIKQTQQLSNLQAPETVQNRGASYIAYQDNTTSNAQTYFASPLNGVPGNPQPLPVTAGGPGQKVWVQQDQVKAGTLLAGVDCLVTYPSNQDFETASALALYRVSDGKASDVIQVTPVAYIEIENQYNPQDNYYQSYDYARSAQSIITYDSGHSLAQFPKVTVVTGSRTPSAGSAPAGISVSYFSNGVAAQGEIPYPGNWVYNYNMLLNGALLQKQQYNKQGELVTSETNYWQLFESSLTQGNFLFGAYFRLSKRVALKDGVSQTTTLTYFQDIGLQQSGTTAYVDAGGETKTVVSERKYAIHIDAYQQAMTQKHLLNAAVQEITSVTGADGVKRYTDANAVTWKNWAEDGSWKWAAFQNYQWLGPADGDPAFDFSDNGPRSAWLKKQQVAGRGLPYSVITEMISVDGVPTSYIYDTEARFQVAEFPGASLSGGEASFYSFEKYETPGGWQTGPTAEIIPNPDDATIDARMGVCSLKMGQGTGLQGQFTPLRQDVDYVFSSYAKLPGAFDVTEGAASWIISFTINGSPVGEGITLPFPEETGVWRYLQGVISLKDLNPEGTPGLVTIHVRAQNDNTRSPVLVDCVRFSPVSSLFAAVSMDPKTNVISGALGANGEIRNKFFDDFQRVIATTGFSGETTSVASSYFSRTGNDNQFSVTDPNSTLKISSAGGGPALSFTKGSEWMQHWSAGDGSTWQTEEGSLCLKSFQNKGTLRYKGDMQSRYGVMTLVTPLEAVTQPLGIQVGEMFTVQWQPSDGSWVLLDASGNVLRQKKLYRFTLPDTHGGDAGALATSMRPRLLRRGMDVSRSETRLKVTTDGVYDAGYGQYYALETSGSQTVVTGIGSQWSLLVNDNSLFFFVDGQLVFNHVSETAIQGVATLFASNKISLEWLLTCFDNQIVFTSINAAGNDIQSQLLDNTRLTVVENIYDNLGRIVAYTKPAFVTSDEAPLFQYFGSFAGYNPEDGSMSGFIADYYPADGGYPYFGTRYEASPLGRVVESSMPGADYKMGTHTQRTAYGANDGSLGLPKGEFFQTTVIDQNDHLSYSLADKRGQQVRKLSQKSTDEEIVAAAFYDDAGNTVELRSPNYREDDPAKDNWVTRLTYNFIGQLTGSNSSTTGEITMIYDRANRLRFRQDAEGASGDNYQYYKYDSAGRIVETGYVTGTWDAPQLQQKADDDPAYPATPDTWRTKTFYDYNGSGEPFQIGQVVKTLTHASDGGTPDVEERFSYDIFGNVKSRSQIVSAFDDNEYTTGFAYNNLGGITRIDYPVGPAGDPLSIFYEYNCIGQITGIGNQAAQPDNLASYSYNPSGKPIEETLNKYAAGTLKRSYTYDSPVWLEQIQDMNGQQELFHETLKTAAGGQGPAYYNGQAAEMSFRYPQDLSPSATYTNWYNGINALEQVDEARGTNAPLTRKYGFDANGNFDAVDVGASTYQYLAEPDKGNRLQSVRDKNDDSLVFGFESNLNGAVSRYTASGKGSTPPGDLGFTYDAGTRMTSAVTDNREGKTFNLFYGSSGDRVLKQERSGASLTTSSLYVNSLSGNTLVKVTTSGNSTRFISMVYGPAGIVAFLRDGSLYNTLKDHLGSVRIILDDAAAVVAAYDYDSYGNVSVLREPEPGFFPYLYCSQELDLELGIYNYKARFYFSTVGRFGAPDSYNQFYSPYIYAGNSPLIYIDPSGNFSIGNFFSAIGGAIIGAFEILIGVAIDAVAGVLEVVTGGLATPVSVGLGMLAGAFIGSGVSAVTYSAAGLITNDFSWKDYGINTAIGFVAGAITAGFGAVGAVAAEAATGVKAAAEAGEAVSTLAKVANTTIKGGFTVAGAEVSATTSTLIGNAANGRSLTTGLGEALVKGVLSSTASYALPALDYKAGWGNLLKRVASNVAKSEAIGVTIQLGSNAIHGASLDTGLLNTVVRGVVSGSIGALKTKDFAKDYTRQSVNFLNFGGPQNQGQQPADGIVRLG